MKILLELKLYSCYVICMQLRGLHPHRLINGDLFTRGRNLKLLDYILYLLPVV